MTDPRSARRRQSAIGRRLRQMYVDVLYEDLPDEFIALLCEAGLQLELKKLDELRKARKRRRGDVSPDDPMLVDALRPNPQGSGPKRPLLSTAAQLEWDGPLANPDSPRQPGPHAMRALRLRQDGIGRQLRKMYADVLNEDPPDEFIKLLCEAGLKLERQPEAPAEDARDGDASDAPPSPHSPD